MPTCDTRVCNPAFRTLAWLAVASQVAAVATVIALPGLDGAPSLGIFLVVSLLCLTHSRRPPSLITLFVVAAAALNGAGWAFDLYDRFVAFDELIHTVSAFAGMAALGYLAGARGLVAAEPMSLEFLTPIVALGLALGIGWELLEMPFIDLTWTDTLVDLVMDTLGAAGGGLVAGWTLSRCETARV